MSAEEKERAARDRERQPDPDESYARSVIRFGDTEEGRALLASRNYQEIIGSRMTLDDVSALRGGPLR